MFFLNVSANAVVCHITEKYFCKFFEFFIPFGFQKIKYRKEAENETKMYYFSLKIFKLDLI